MPPAVANRSSSRKRFHTEAAGGGRRLVGRGWAERRRVKLERERSERSLMRRSEADRWGRGPLEVDESTRGEDEEQSGAADGWGGKLSAEESSAGELARPVRPSVASTGDAAEKGTLGGPVPIGSEIASCPARKDARCRLNSKAGSRSAQRKKVRASLRPRGTAVDHRRLAS